MNNNGQKKSPGTNGTSPANNPFARALAETEKSSYNNQQSAGAAKKNPFSEALAKTGDGLTDDYLFDSEWEAIQKQKLKEEQQREALKRKLHDRVNPVDNKDLFDAREKQVKKEIEELRKELKLLSKEVAAFDRDIELTLMTETVDPGEGKYYINFFQKLRAFIMLLRKRIHSARTWATQMQTKKRKKRGAGLMSLEGKGGHEKTKTIYDMMHHEVSNARSGG